MLSPRHTKIDGIVYPPRTKNRVESWKVPAHLGHLSINLKLAGVTYTWS